MSEGEGASGRTDNVGRERQEGRHVSIQRMRQSYVRRNILTRTVSMNSCVKSRIGMHGQGRRWRSIREGAQQPTTLPSRGSLPVYQPIPQPQPSLSTHLFIIRWPTFVSLRSSVCSASRAMAACRTARRSVGPQPPTPWLHRRPRRADQPSGSCFYQVPSRSISSDLGPSCGRRRCSESESGSSSADVTISPSAELTDLALLESDGRTMCVTV